MPLQPSVIVQLKKLAQDGSDNRILYQLQTALEETRDCPNRSRLLDTLNEAIDELAVHDYASQLAASEAGCGCSGEAPPSPNDAHLKQAQSHLVKRLICLLQEDQELDI
jgi:hypothetical protein